MSISGKKEKQKKQNLLSLLLKKRELEDEIIESGGEITEDIESIWNDNSIAIKEKVDSYGRLIEDIEAELEKFKLLDKSRKEKISKVTNRLNSLKQQIKTRLNYFSNGESLVGDLYKFNPFNSIRRSIKDESLIEDKYKKINIEFNLADWKKISNTINIEFKEKKVSAVMSDLPEGHAAVEAKITPSVRIL